MQAAGLSGRQSQLCLPQRRVIPPAQSSRLHILVPVHILPVRELHSCNIVTGPILKSIVIFRSDNNFTKVGHT